MADNTFRIHPAIGFARVGDSDEYYLAPETAAALPDPDGGETTGGLPIKAGTQSTPITDQDIRDSQGRFKKQAARFRIYQYPGGQQSYPDGGGTEVVIGSEIGGKTVTDIVWTVHLANKKTNCYLLPEPDTKGDQIIDRYDDCKTPPARNKDYAGTNDLENQKRRTDLQIDPGPRAFRGTSAGSSVSFDPATTASFVSSGDTISENADYPQSFPQMHFPNLYCPAGQIESLGALEAEDNGRLLVVPANGTAVAFDKDQPLDDDVNNDGWFDDTADGPVYATLVFDDGSTVEAQGAWVISTDPGYAPQTLNVVSLWDDIYNTFVEDLALQPELFDNGSYQKSYEPDFDGDVYPVFRAAWMQQWNTNLPEPAKAGHDAVNAITADDTPADYLHVKSIIRDPNQWETESEEGSPKMPLSLGDSGMSFLMVSKTQYFFLTQWFDGAYRHGNSPVFGPGEVLDKVTLQNCLGGRFSPGIDMTFIVRQPGLWKSGWETEGPFRINDQKLDYTKATQGQPFLTAGWFPLRSEAEGCPPVSPGVEPGDTSKFMALPWHTDYNSCATHTPAPNPEGNLTLYWSWPAQRPVAVYAATDYKDGQLGQQLYSVRGPGTQTEEAQDVGRFQERLDMVENWTKIGVIMQGTAIESGDYPADVYLEVESQLEDSGNRVLPWPNTVRDKPPVIGE